MAYRKTYQRNVADFAVPINKKGVFILVLFMFMPRIETGGNQARGKTWLTGTDAGAKHENGEKVTV
ncbi:MAG: hypothetical protein JRJ29_01765 [Deltaproteobacteria bacterium]|nr:hypothetical protein [Deltaproteobacteria bacterium]